MIATDRTAAEAPPLPADAPPIVTRFYIRRSDIAQHGHAASCGGSIAVRLETPPAGSHRSMPRSRSRLAQGSHRGQGEDSASRGVAGLKAGGICGATVQTRKLRVDSRSPRCRAHRCGKGAAGQRRQYNRGRRTSGRQLH